MVLRKVYNDSCGSNGGEGIAGVGTTDQSRVKIFCKLYH